MKFSKNICILIIVTCTVFFCGIISCISFFTTRSILQDNASEILHLQCTNTCQEFNASIDSIEQAVEMVTSAAMIHMHDFERFKTDNFYVEEYTASLAPLLLDTVQNTQGAMSIYMRYNPEIAPADAGLFYVLNPDTGNYDLTPNTDLDNTDTVNRIWYDIPVANGVPTWINPYFNHNISYNMISYVIPYYIDNTLVGIIGMDIDYEYIKDMINDITVYDTGFAFLLTRDKQIVVHRDFALFDFLPESDKYILQNSRSACQDTHTIYQNADNSSTIIYMNTKNDMLLGVSVPNTEIYRASLYLGQELFVIVIISLVIIAILTTIIISKAFRLSQMDELTRIHNRKYFIDIYNHMDEEKRTHYCLFLFDIDHFKNINDTYGHNIGDTAIKNTAQSARQFLGHDCILARWGGDEFIGLIKTKKAKEQLEQFRSMIENTASPDYGNLTISIGVTEIGACNKLIEVTEAADTALYHSKSTGRNKMTYISKQSCR